MASKCLNFSDIRLILSVQGYELEYQFVLREIGFWTRKTVGSLPFNCKINKNQLDVKSQVIISEFEELNGIKMKKNCLTGLAQSELKPALRTLYHLSECDSSKYIGVFANEKIIGLLAKSGLGDFVFELQNLDIFRYFGIEFPTDELMKSTINENPESYPICQLHDCLQSNDTPICSRAKSNFIANYCLYHTNCIKKNLPDDNTEYESILKQYNITPVKE